MVRDHLTNCRSDLAGGGPVRIVAVGKAAVAMARGAFDVLADRIEDGIVIAPRGTTEGAPRRLTVFEGGHPIPNEAGVRGAEAILELAVGLTEREQLLCLISGGGSALMTLPPAGVGLADVQTTTDALLRAGATIEELNAVRKHLDRLKGGRLAAAAMPARVVALVLSDVVGDPLDVIASGPVSPDPRTFRDAWGVIESRGVLDGLPAAARSHLEAGLQGAAEESPKPDDRCFDRVEAAVIGSNRMAATAALDAAAGRGYQTRLLGTEVVGEARQVGVELAALGLAIAGGDDELSPPACLVAAGETTVEVRGRGRGGRNQELVLGASLALARSERVLVGSMGTDGVDGPTDAAGALADGRTRARAEAAGIDVEERLALNDSYRVFEALDDLIVTGPTGTNVMDLMLVLVG